jgi:hypothetical protein
LLLVHGGKAIGFDKEIVYGDAFVLDIGTLAKSNQVDGAVLTIKQNFFLFSFYFSFQKTLGRGLRFLSISRMYLAMATRLHYIQIADPCMYLEDASAREEFLQFSFG